MRQMPEQDREHHENEAISKLRGMLRRGEHSIALRETEAIEHLKGLVKLADYKNVRCLDSSSILAELYDQTSKYFTAAQQLSFDDRGRLALADLKKYSQVSNVTLKTTAPTSGAIRARAMFCLSHAIAWHRETTDKSDALRHAVSLATKVRDCLLKLADQGHHFEGALSFVCYWLGRFQMLRQHWAEAELMFGESVAHQQANLSYHLDEHQRGALHHDVGTSLTCAMCFSHIGLTNYLLASNMAFGIATIKLEKGAISEGITLLHAAALLLEGSTNDRYRKGYAKLLIGTGQRALAGSDAKALRDAIATLKRAQLLFEPDRPSDTVHTYYAAKVHYQICLADISLARYSKASPTDKKLALQEALYHYCSLASKNGGEHADPYADVDLELRSRLLSSRLFCLIISDMAQSPNGEIGSSIASYANNIKHLQRFSPSLSKASTPGRYGAATRDLVIAEALQSVKSAEAFQTELHEKHPFRSSIKLADADVASTIFEHMNALGLQQESNYRLAELERCRKDLSVMIGTGHHHPKDAAAMHIALARITFLQGDRMSARRRLEGDWRSLSSQVENRIVHDLAEQLLDTIAPATHELIINLEEQGSLLSSDAILDQLHFKLLESLNHRGLSVEKAALGLGMEASALRNWCKRVGYQWRRGKESV